MGGLSLWHLIILAAFIAWPIFLVVAYVKRWEKACIAIAVICGAIAIYIAMKILFSLNAGVPLTALGRSFIPVAPNSFFAWLFHRRWKAITDQKLGIVLPDTAFDRWARAKQEMRYGSVAEDVPKTTASSDPTAWLEEKHKQ